MKRLFRWLFGERYVDLREPDLVIKHKRFVTNVFASDIARNGQCRRVLQANSITAGKIQAGSITGNHVSHWTGKNENVAVGYRALKCISNGNVGF